MNQEALFSVNDPVQLRLHFDKIRPALTIVRQRRECMQAGSGERTPYDWLMQDFHGHPTKEDHKEVAYPDQPHGKKFPHRYLAKFSLSGLIAVVRTTEPGRPATPEETMVITADLPEKTVIPWLVTHIGHSRVYEDAQEYRLALPSMPQATDNMPFIEEPVDALTKVTEAWRHAKILDEERSREPKLVLGPGYKAFHKPGGGVEQLVNDLIFVHLGLEMYYKAEESSQSTETRLFEPAGAGTRTIIRGD